MLKILQKLLFFQRYNEKICREIAQDCQLVEIPAKTKIYSPGQFDDHMYVILRGSVQLRRHAEGEIGKALGNMPITTKFDGENFGE